MSNTTSNSSELTREQVATMLLHPLEEASTFLKLGPTIFDTDGSQVRVPIAPGTQQDNLQWIGEAEQIPTQDYDFSEVSLLPSTMKSIKTITRFSNELSRQSIVALDSVLQARIVSDVANRYDAQFLSDQGDGITTPKGLFAQTASEDVEVVGDLTIDAIFEGLGVALSNNVQTDSLTLLVRPENFMQLRTQADNDGRSLVQPDATRGLSSPILGTNVVISNRIPAGRAALVRPSNLGVARDVFPTVTRLTELYAGSDEQGVRVVSRADLGILDSSGLVTFTIA